VQRQVDLIFGPTGSGKTWAARELLQKTPRGLVVDADFREFPVVYFQDLASLDAHLESIGAYSNRWVPFRLGYTPRDADEFDIMCEMAFHLPSSRTFFEEADRWPDPSRIPWLNELIVRGRHVEAHLCFLALHPFLISKDIRRQGTSVITYRQTEPDDVKWLAELVGPLAHQLPELAGPGADHQGVVRHPPFPRLEWRPGSGARIVHPGGRVELAAAPEAK
jgi:hypothetical protein